MLKPRKKITKKKLKEDKLVTTVYKTQRFLETEWKKIVIGLGAALIIIFIGNYAYNSGLERENQAAGELFPYEFRYFAAAYDSTLVSGLEQFLVNYEDTDRAASATLYLANTYYYLGDYIKSEELYRKYIDDYSGPDFLKASALGGIAACFEQRKLFKDAAEYYDRAINKYPEVFVTSEHLLGAARVYIELGNPDIARERLEKVVEDYAGTNQALQAEYMIAQL